MASEMSIVFSFCCLLPFSRVVDGPFFPFSTSGGTSLQVAEKLTPPLPSPSGHPERPYHALIAGAIGGYCVWGQYSSVNYQIVLYLTSRVLTGVTKRIWEHLHNNKSSTRRSSSDNWVDGTKKGPSPSSSPSSSSILQHPQTYKILAATVWGLVMILFEESPHVLHKSLKQSMDEIYRYPSSSLVPFSESASSRKPPPPPPSTKGT